MLDKMFPPNEAKILQFFLSNPEEDISIPEIIDALEMPKITAYRNTKKLLTKGIITPTRKVWKEQYYRLNLNNDVVKLLLGKKPNMPKIKKDGGVEIKFDRNILNLVKKVWARFMDCKVGLLNELDFSSTVMVLLLVALQSNIKEGDVRIREIVDYLKNGNLHIDEGRVKKLADKIIRAVYYVGGEK